MELPCIASEGGVLKDLVAGCRQVCKLARSAAALPMSDDGSHWEMLVFFAFLVAIPVVGLSCLALREQAGKRKSHFG